MGFYFDNRDTRLEGSLLLTLLAIADHADSTGAAMGPSLDLIVERVRLGSRRQVQRLVKELEELGYLQIQRGQGRGKRSFYQLLRPEVPAQSKAEKTGSADRFSEQEIKGDTHVIFSEEVKGDTDVSFFEQEKVTSETIKGDIAMSSPPTPPYKDNLLNPLENKAVAVPPRGKVSAENFGPPQNLGKKIGDHHFLDFRELLDRAAPHLSGEHLADVRKMWMSGVAPLEVIKCYNTMRMETWRTSRITWKTVAGYLPDWKFRKEKGIEPGKENTNYGKPKKIRSADDYAAALERWEREYDLAAQGRNETGHQPDQPDAVIAGLLPA